jgi:hypothetical protein
MAVYVTGYGLGRLWVEALRIDQATQIAGFRVNTWISLVAIVGGLAWLFWGGSPVDRDATAELRAGGDPQAHVGARGGTLADLEGLSDEEIHAAATEIDADPVEQRSGDHLAEPAAEPEAEPVAEPAADAADEVAEADEPADVSPDADRPAQE